MQSRDPQIEFIASGSESCPILQISNTNLETARDLYFEIKALRISMAGSFLLHEVKGFERCRSLKLIFEISEKNEGVIPLKSEDGYKCALSYDGWICVEDLLSPFCHRVSSMTGFQWLDESSDISLLFSPSGGW